MSRITIVDPVPQQPIDPNESAPTFSYSIKAMKDMAAKRRSGLFLTEFSLTEVQRNYLFERLKAHVKDTLAPYTEIHGGFRYQLMMASPDANAFLNILAGWRSSASKAHESLLDTCIRDFKTLYPEIYEFIDGQAPIYKPT